MNGCLTKPFDARQLEAKLNEILPSTEPILNQSISAQPSETDEFRYELIDVFLLHIASQLSAIETDIAQENWNGMEVMTHRLRGQLASLDAFELANQFAELESAAAEAAAMTVSESWPAVKEALLSYVSGLKLEQQLLAQKRRCESHP